MSETIYFLGHRWTVKKVPNEELPPDTLCISDWQRLTVRISKELAPPVFEEVLLHEIIELTVLDNRVVENIKGTSRSINDDADYIAECIDSVVQNAIRSNLKWFPITRGVDAVYSTSGSGMSEDFMDEDGTSSETL